ncbi:hypothetical protein [Actinacidiphila sp. bgisy144]|uniref:hypothetical protein n=1 Tax=Actinacidiphila sp. bgisy144 TaxID=3413791 RepID=UPI003EBFDD50
MQPTDSASAGDHPLDPAAASRQRPEVDFHLNDFSADDQILQAFYKQVGFEDCFVPLAEHHTADGHSYYVLFDESATYDHPGTSEIVALHLRRDRDRQTFDFEQAPLPLPAMAQSWLIHRGCPPDAIGLDPELGPQPTDDATRTLEQRLVGDGDHFAMGYCYTSDDPDDMVVVVALRSMDERAPSPFRVLVREIDAQSWTHTLREGGFDTVHEALQWCRDRLTGKAGPLPPVRAAAANRPAGVAKNPATRPPGRSR